MMQQPRITVGLPAINEVTADSLPAAAAQYSVNPMQVIMAVGMFIWCIGAAAILLYSTGKLVCLCLHLRAAIKLEDRIYQSDCICSPFVLGLLHPKIYLPFGLDADTPRYVPDWNTNGSIFGIWIT